MSYIMSNLIGLTDSNVYSTVGVRPQGTDVAWAARLYSPIFRNQALQPRLSRPGSTAPGGAERESGGWEWERERARERGRERDAVWESTFVWSSSSLSSSSSSSSLDRCYMCSIISIRLHSYVLYVLYYMYWIVCIVLHVLYYMYSIVICIVFVH
jgi:hypothetical protein